MPSAQQRHHGAHHGTLGTLMDWLEQHLHLESHSKARGGLHLGKARKDYSQTFFRNSRELDEYVKDCWS